MRTKLLFLLFLFGFFKVNAQIDFQEHYISDGLNTTEEAKDVHAADIDGDGDMDILSASYKDFKIAWYENIDGNGNFGPQQIITTDLWYASTVYAADIDGDNDLDVIAGSLSSFGAKITWYENTNGQGNFSTQNIISSNGDHIRSVYAADLDTDGDMDVLSADSEKVAWYENINGQGNFGSEQIIQNGSGKSAYASDLDLDGDMDILYSTNIKIAWQENTNGSGNFGTEQIISTNLNNVHSIHSTDIDDDGDMDVLASVYSDDKIAWYENTDGQGNFGAQQIISTTATEAKSVFSADFDNDGDMDVISGSGYGYYTECKIAWYENTDSNGNFSSEQIITTSVRGAESVYATDINGDGDIDVLSASSQDNKIAWYKNTDGQGSFGEQQPIITGPTGPNYIRSDDMDSDGDNDVVFASSADNKIGWYENIDGQGNFGEQQIITLNVHRPKSLCLIDIDGDADMDVVSGSGKEYLDGKVAWYENTDGQGGFGPQQIVSTQVSSLKSIYAIDIDGDTDTDILSASTGDDKIAWYENTDGQGTFGPQQIITTTANGAISVYAADLNDDGNMDVLSASTVNHKITWYENLNGQGNFGTPQTIEQPVEYPEAVCSDDLDNDGDMDVLYANRYEISWNQNVDGLGNFNSSNIIKHNAHYALFVHTADIDADGDKDVIGAGDWDHLRGTNLYGIHKLAWYENMNGLGSFSTQKIITNEAEDLWSAYPSDINGDNRIDVVSAYGNKITWFENLGLASINESTLKYFSLYPNPTSGILKINSKTPVKKIEVRNSLGQLVLNNFNQTQIDLSKLAQGIYFVEITGENGKTETKKIVKK